MYSIFKTALLTTLLCAVPAVMRAQFDFTLDGRQVQIHSFASQGFMYSNDNNYLTTNTSQGSFAFTDFGANVSTQVTDKFRVGAQIYDRNLGKLGNWRPSLDWAVADYRFKDWFGIRAGKVKTTLGLFNDTQDMEFLQTWALMPQSVYPLDQRGSIIAHEGGDIYGNIGIKKLGGLSYTVYGGKRPYDSQDGYPYSLDTSLGTRAANGITNVVPNTSRKVNSSTGPVFGADLRWNTPVKGLMAGTTFFDQDTTTKGIYRATGNPFLIAGDRNDDKDHTLANYLEYTIGNLRFDGEYRREILVSTSNTSTGAWNAPSGKDIRSGYVALSYRLMKRLEVGSYYSRFYYDWASPHDDPSNYIFDRVATARVDLTNFLDLKVEGHFMEGIMRSATINRGFYVAANANGLQPDTHLLVIRLGYHL
jgi:hypothetical protein